MRILFFYPRHAGKEDVPPFEFMTASAMIGNEHEKKLLDQNANPSSLDDIASQVENYNPDFTICLGRNIKTYSEIKTSAAVIKSVSNTPIICIGDVTVAYNTLIERTQLDYVVAEDFEVIFPEIVGLIASGNDIAEISGVITKERKAKGHIGKNILRNLDILPFPDYELIDREHYFGRTSSDAKFTPFLGDNRFRELAKAGKRSMEVYASRGCNQRCSFCSNRCTGNRKHSIDYVIDHINVLKDRYDVGFIDFGDPCFTEGKKSVENLLNELKIRCDGILFRVYGARTDQVTPDMLQSFKDAGCVGIYFGVESGNQSSLNLMEKNNSVKQNVDALLAAKDLGLYSPLQLIIGFPQFDESETIKSFDVFRRMGIQLDASKIRCILPVPGTPIYKEFKARGLIRDEEQYLLNISNLDSNNFWIPGISESASKMMTV